MRIKRLKKEKETRTSLKNFKSPYVIKTDKNDPLLPSIFTYCGARGSGKTYAAVSMLRSFEKKGYITRSFLICPTHKSNRIFENLKTLDEMDCCDEEGKFSKAMNDLMDQIKSDWQIFEDEKKYLKVYKKYVRKSHSLKFEEESLLEQENYRRPEKLKQPGHMVIFDDCQNTSVYSNNVRNNLLQHLAIKHRHIPVSICFLVQSWAGLPKTLRLNSVVFLLFKTGNRRELYWIWENFGASIEFEQFMEMYSHAVEEKHSFLYIDTAPKKDYMRFRKGFNKYLLPEEMLK